MSDVTFARLAAADLGDIWDYTFDTWGVAQAETYVDDIEAICADLATGLRIGRPEPVLEGCLRYPVGKHVVYYKRAPRGIIVLRALHQRMDVARHLEDDGE